MSKVGRNVPCPCGSGQKHKKCCLGKAPVHEPAPPAVGSAEVLRAATTDDVARYGTQVGRSFEDWERERQKALTQRTRLRARASTPRNAGVFAASVTAAANILGASDNAEAAERGQWLAERLGCRTRPRFSAATRSLRASPVC